MRSEIKTLNADLAWNNKILSYFIRLLKCGPVVCFDCISGRDFGPQKKLLDAIHMWRIMELSGSDALFSPIN
jgi:hypothetical protein